MNPKAEIVRIGADVGGTFTDVIVIDGRGGIWTHKVPSTPPNFEEAVLNAIAHLLKESGIHGRAVRDIAHGTTVATNAVLEQRGAKTALVTTKGFRDVLELRRIRAPQMYDLFFDKPPELVERYLRFEVTERLSAQGEVLIPLDEKELDHLKDALLKEKVESVAICTLHSYAYPEHERIVGKYLEAHLDGIPISLSSEVLPERKEYERTATTVVNAYVRPVMANYLESMRTGLGHMEIKAPVLIMQSAGGLTPEADAARKPVYVLESGPAAGVLAAGFVAKGLGINNVVTFDMGGTTAKASMIEGGKISYSPEYEVGATVSAGNRLVGGGGELIRAPSIDIAEVGSGGGSIAYLDAAGGLRVGPRSAGAIPGPVCYGRGGKEPTVTDANVVLGYIRPGELADGEVRVDPESARRAVMDQVAIPLGMSLMEAAEGIHRIANARSMRALRAVSTERGRDPRDFILMAFGGSGPIHAVGLAKELMISEIIVPEMPGLFSALGLLFSGVEHHDVRSCLLTGEALTTEALAEHQADMAEDIIAQFRLEGYGVDEVRLNYSADVRFKGQASEIRIPLGEQAIDDAGISRMCEAFEGEHEQLYGHRSDPDNPIEVIAVRLIGRVESEEGGSKLQRVDRSVTGSGSREAYFGKQFGLVDTPVVNRGDLDGGISGPVLIDEYDSTIVIPPGMRASCDEEGNVRITSGE
jgi:N-methylhydantoinase A